MGFGEPKVSAATVARLPGYLRAIDDSGRTGGRVQSGQIASNARTSPVLVRKDLAYFGRFGVQGRGYSRDSLAKELRQILGLDRSWDVCLVGVGRLGSALIGYPGFLSAGFRLMAAFDVNPSLIGSTVGGVRVDHLERLPTRVARLRLSIAILSVPAPQAQPVTDLVVRSGIRAILNYAPVPLVVPRNVVVRSLDPVAKLQAMCFHLRNDITRGQDSSRLDARTAA